jgi:hypothetical protein
MIERLTNVQLPLPPPPSRLYLAVKVVLPGVRPLRTADALARCNVPDARVTALASTAAALLAPDAANDTKHETAPELPVMPLVTETRTLPEAGTVNVTAGPPVVRSTYVVDVVVCDAATLSATVPAVPVEPVAPVGPRAPVTPFAPVVPFAPVEPFAPVGP